MHRQWALPESIFSAPSSPSVGVGARFGALGEEEHGAVRHMLGVPRLTGDHTPSPACSGMEYDGPRATGEHQVRVLQGARPASLSAES